MTAAYRPLNPIALCVMGALALGLSSQPAFAESPSTPTRLAASAAASGVELTWSASTDDDAVAGYNIYRNNQYLTTVSDTRYVLPGAPSVGDYFYIVAFDEPSAGETRAFSERSLVLIIDDDDLSTATPPVTSTPPASGADQTPTAPTALSAQRASATSVELMWSGASDDVADCRLQRVSR